MDKKNPATLTEIAIQSLLSNELATIQALEEMPRGLFVPVFNAAFKGGHKKILTQLVKVWPFVCLHVGALRVQASQHECLKAMVDGLQVPSAQNFASRCSKLRILDLRKNTDCRTTCPEISNKSPICLHSCAYSEHSILKIEAEQSIVNSESETQSCRKAMELLVNLSLNGTLSERGFLFLLLSKVEQSLGSLHLCCRDLQIDTLSYRKSMLPFLDMLCIDNLEVEKASLSDINILLSQVGHLKRLSLCKIIFVFLNGDIFRSFVTQLERMINLKELKLSYFILTNHLEKVLRALQPTLEYLYLPFCELSYSDFTCLSQCPQIQNLKLLNLSHNSMFLEDCENVQILLDNISGTLRHLMINHCMLIDSTISVLLPALGRCSRLQVFSFISNPITMSMLMRIVQHLTPLMELKHVTYPIPVHCYDGWYFHGKLDEQKLVDVQAQIKMKVMEAHREDMKWSTGSQ